MKALTCLEHGKFALIDKPKPTIRDPRDAVVWVPYVDHGLSRIPDSVTADHPPL